MTRLLPTSSFVLFLAAGVASAQAGASTSTVPVLRRPLRVAVGVAEGATLPAYLVRPGVQHLGTVAGGDVELLVFLEGTSLGDLGLLANLVAADPAVTFVERDLPTGAPEVVACGLNASPDATDWASAQDCTVAFFDGTPTPEEYFDQPAMPIVGAAAAHGHLPGAPSLVAVIDTGVDLAHPALAGRLSGPGLDLVGSGAAWDVANGFDDDGDGQVDEAFGHGTHVAGTIALVNPQATILPIRVLDSDGNGSAFDVALAIEHAVASGADVVNLSLGLSANSGAVTAAIVSAAQQGVQVVAAAGNVANAQVGFPARLPHVTAVAALDDADVCAWFSSRGQHVDLAAPGVDVYGPMPGGAWARWSGTSMACAVASGSVSLAHTLAGETGEGAHVVEDHAWSVEAQNPGLDGALGHGRVDLAHVAEDIFEEEGD